MGTPLRLTVSPQKFHFTEEMVWGLGGGTAEDSRTQQAAAGGGVWIAERLGGSGSVLILL